MPVRIEDLDLLAVNVKTDAHASLDEVMNNDLRAYLAGTSPAEQNLKSHLRFLKALHIYKASNVFNDQRNSVGATVRRSITHPSFGRPE